MQQKVLLPREQTPQWHNIQPRNVLNGKNDPDQATINIGIISDITENAINLSRTFTYAVLSGENSTFFISIPILKIPSINYEL